MRYKTIFGTYTAGYTLSPSFTGLSITSTGLVDGVSGLAAGAGASGGRGGAGVTLPLGGRVLNHGMVGGGVGGTGGYGASGQAGGTGGGGGDGIDLLDEGGGGSFGAVTGGRGCAGGGANGPANGGAGGAGAAGVVLSARGVFSNSAEIDGGQGGVGGQAFSAADLQSPAGGAGGAGEAGVYLSAAGRVDNVGTIAGGAGGAGGYGGRGAYYNGFGGAGGGGGAGIILSEGGEIRNFGLIAGGNGGAGGAYYYGGPPGGVVREGPDGDSGAGVALSHGGRIVNYGAIAGGVTGYPLYPHSRGTGVVLSAGGVVTNGRYDLAHESIKGGIGVCAAAGAKATVKNYGVIAGYSGAGVQLQGGGVVANGATNSPAGLIEGGDGVAGAYDAPGGIGAAGVLFSAVGTVTNYGSIQGGLGGFGGRGPRPGAGAGGAGGVGAALAGGGDVVNSGVIEGGRGGYGFGSAAGGDGGAGVALSMAGDVTNKGLIEGGFGDSRQGMGGAGVSLAASGVVTNLATVEGGFGSARGTGVLVAAGGLVINGDAAHTAAMIEGAVGVQAFGSAATTVTNFGTIEGAGRSVILSSSNDRVVVEAGAQFLGAIAGGGGVLELAGGTGSITGLSGLGTISGGDFATFSGFGGLVIDAGGVWTFTGPNEFNLGVTLTNRGTSNVVNVLRVNGALVNSGAIILATGSAVASLVIGADTTLSGGGTVALSSAGGNRVVGVSASTILTNIDNTITGAGQLGDHRLTLVNQAKGTINASGTSALIIDTGANTIANAGTIEASGAGGGIVASAVANTGTLMAAGGVLTVEGAVSGAGRAAIDGGTLDFTSTFNENVFFGAAGGVLELAQSQSYTAAILGFSLTGGTSLDLRDIAFVGVGEVVFKGTANAGVLIVSDGTHTARIRLVGDYRASSFVASSDGHGGVLVVDPARTAASPSPLPLIAAMAGFGAGGGEPVHAIGESWRAHPALIGVPRMSIA